MPGYAHQIVINAPAANFFETIDFGTNRSIDGPATAVGTSRTILLGKGSNAPKIVEMQVAEGSHSHQNVMPTLSPTRKVIHLW